MGVIKEIAGVLIDSLGNLFFWAVLLRFLLQLARADFYNPISQGLVRITNPVLKPIRRLIPGLFGIDMAALVLAVAVKFALVVVAFLLRGTDPHPVMLLWSILACVVTIFNIYYLAILATIILSWVAAGSHHPAVVLINQIAEPVLAPFRRLLPAMGGIDFSPMIAFVAIYVVQILLRAAAASVGLNPHTAFGMLSLGI